MIIEVSQSAPQRVDVVVPGSVEVELDTPETRVVVGTGLPQQNLYVGPIEPEFSGPGIWIQTELGTDGENFEIWFEDGK